MKLYLLIGMIVAHACFLLPPEWGLKVHNLLFLGIAPAFGGLVAYNATVRSSDSDAYAKRLFIWGLISQPFHALYFGSWWQPNVLFWLAAIAWSFPRLKDLPTPKLPNWFFYSIYPTHFVILTLLKHV